MRNNDELSFVFMDESGKKESDRFFVCGFLQIEDNVLFVRSLQRVHDQIKNLAIRNRQQRVETLRQSGDIEQLYNLARTFNEFELKHYLITEENRKLYIDLLKALWKKTQFRYTAIVIDRHDPRYVRSDNEHDVLYLRALKVYAMHCAPTCEYVYVPDNFDINFEWNVQRGHLPVTIVPLQSNASLQLQVCDILSGLVAQAWRTTNGIQPTNKDDVRADVVAELEQLIGHHLNEKFTVNTPHYFNVWPLKLTEK